MWFHDIGQHFEEEIVQCDKLHVGYFISLVFVFEMFVGNIVGVLLMEEYFEIDEVEDQFVES